MTAELQPVLGCDNRHRIADIIFIHGLDGGAESTWEEKDKPETFWPRWIGEDCPKVGVWALDYDASSIAWRGDSMPLYDRANTTLNLFEQDHIGHRPIGFVCHSLGGLLIKQILRNAKDSKNSAWQAVVEQTRFIVFLSTPHSGSSMANWIQYIGKLLRTSVNVRELEAHAPQLRQLNIWYRDHFADLDIKNFVYCEERKTGRVWRLGGVLVVDKTSADPGIPGVTPISLDEDHISICKPTRTGNRTQVYRQVKQMTEELVNVSVPCSGGTLSQTEVSGAVTRRPLIQGTLEINSSGSFHVFLSHNSEDKPIVRKLAQALKSYDLKVWLDEEQLVPGQLWQKALEIIIQTTQAAAVLIGQNGMGPWENPEINACLSEFVKRKLPVIPVLLPGAPAKPELPLFLQSFTWVDLRDGLTEQGLKRLVWGIKYVNSEESPRSVGNGLQRPESGAKERETEKAKIRSRELETLVRWVSLNKCRLIVLYGSEGIGKTTLADEVANNQEINVLFKVVPCSLGSRPTLQFLANYVAIQLGSDAIFSGINNNDYDTLSRMLLQILDKHCCLVILDDYDCILQNNDYMPGYEGYASLLNHAAQSQGKGCLLVSSLIFPPCMAELTASRQFETLQLKELDFKEGRVLMESNGNFFGFDEDWKTLIDNYGRPLYLVILAKYISKDYGGDIHRFLEEDVKVDRPPLDIEKVLDKQWERLSALQRDIMYWFAVNREPVDLTGLLSDLLRGPSRMEVSQAIDGLKYFFPLIETSRGAVSLEKLVLNWVTRKLIDDVCDEISHEKIRVLRSHALIKIHAEEHIRNKQIRRIVNPLLKKLYDSLLGEIENYLGRCIKQVPKLNHREAKGYAAGNLLNLLLSLQTPANIASYNISNRFIWNADLRQGWQLRGVDFRGCECFRTEFLQIFSSVQCVAFNSKGDHFASGHSDGTVYVWNLEDFSILNVFDEHKVPLWSLGFGPPGYLAAGYEDGVIRVFRNYSEFSKNRRVSPEQNEKVLSLAWASDGKRLVSGTDTGKIQVWDTTKAELSLVNHWHAHDGGVHCLIFSPKDSILASASSDETVKLWLSLDGTIYCPPIRHTDAVYTVDFDPTGECIVTGGKDGYARIWSISKTGGELIDTLEGHRGSISSALFYGDGKQLVTGSHDNTIRLWRSDDGMKWNASKPPLEGHMGGINKLAVEKRRLLLCSGGFDQAIRLWDLNSGACLWLKWGYAALINSVRFIDDHTIACGGNENLILIGNLNKRTWVDKIPAKSGHVNYLAVSQDGRMLAIGGGNGKVRICEQPLAPPSIRRCFSLGVHDDKGVICIAINPANPKMLASIGRDNKVRIWEKNRDRTVPLPASKHRGAVAFNPEGTMLAFSGEDGAIKIWDIVREEEKFNLTGHPRAKDRKFFIHSLTFNTEGTLLASSADDNLIKLWDLNNRELNPVILEGHESYVTDLAFHPTAPILVSSSGDHTVRVWRYKSGLASELLVGLEGYEKPVHSVAFNPQGTILVSAGLDAIVKVWEVENGNFSFNCDLPLPKPYEGMKIGGMKIGGAELNEAQLSTFKKLGAIVDI